MRARIVHPMHYGFDHNRSIFNILRHEAFKMDIVAEISSDKEAQFSIPCWYDFVS